MSDKLKGSIILLITAAVWGSGFIAQKLGGQAMPPLTFNTFRQLLAAIALLPLALVSVKKSGYFSKTANTSTQINNKRNKLIAAAVVCGSFLIIGSNLQQLGLQTVSAGKSGFISATYVVFVPIIGMMMGEKGGKKSIFCAFLALFGFAVMSLSADGKMTQGDWLTLLSSIGFSFQILAINRFVDKGNSLLLTVCQLAFVGTVGLLIAVIIEHPTLAQFQAAIPILAYTVFVPTCIGYPGQVIGQRHTGATLGSLVLSLEAVFATMFGAALLGESMSIREIAGSIIIFAAVIISQVELRPKGEKMLEAGDIDNTLE